MDDRFTYSSGERVTLTVYVAPGYQPPDILALDKQGEDVVFYRLSDMSLECRPVQTMTNSHGVLVPLAGECGSFDCHRRELGKCQCGRHEAPVRFSRDGT